MEMNETARFKLLLAFMTMFIAVCYPVVKLYLETYLDNLSEKTIIKSNLSSDSIESEIIKAWNKLLKKPERKNIKIAIGMNTNVDLIISGTEFFNKLKLNEPNGIKNHEMIENLKQFKECFMHFFRRGSAAERFFTNSGDFEKVLELVTDVKQQWFIGGNAALMAQGISKRFIDAEILLIGPVGPKLKELLSNNVRVLDDTFIEKDEVHLILEYEAKETFENIQTPQANRFIVSYDVKNSRMELIDEFFNITSIQKPDITIISGLHLLETQNSSYRSETLKKLTNKLKNRVEQKMVHLELGSISEKFLMSTILNSGLLNEINSLGLNEQELLFLAYASEKAPHSNYYMESSGALEYIKIVDILEWILSAYGSKANSKSQFSRIHFHYLKFHIIAENGAGEWSNSISSLVSGSKIAAKQACGFDFDDLSNEVALEDFVEMKIPYEVDENKNIFLKMDQENAFKFNASEPVIQFQRGNIQFYFTPTLVCKKPLKTVGLGDAISSNGILYTEFRKI